MGRYQAFAVLITIGPALFLVGCQRQQDSRKSERTSSGRSEPVLHAGDDAQSVIGKAVMAHGGEKAFVRWNCGCLKYKVKGDSVPGPRGEVTFEDTFQLPGHFKRITYMDVGGKELSMVFVINHGKGWSKEGDAPADPIDNDFTKRTEHPVAGCFNLLPLTEGGTRLTTLGEEKIDGQGAMGVRVQFDKLGEVDFHFGKQTGLLLRIKKSLPGAERDKPAVIETFLYDYKDVQGGKVPMRIKVVQDGKEILDEILLDVKFTDKFGENTFSKP